MEELSYSFHLSNDKNKTIKAKQEALNSPSGTTSKNNNAIQNIKHLGKVNHHNLRQYDKKTELITTIKGSNDIIKDVKDLYLDLFDEARINYNNKHDNDCQSPHLQSHRLQSHSGELRNGGKNRNAGLSPGHSA